MKIRDDLDGVVYVHLSGGGVACLTAGDTVPDGVTVGDHLIAKAAKPAAPAEDDAPADSAPARPRRSRTAAR